MAPAAKLKARYEIKDILGQGGMGIVYRAYDVVTRRFVTLKTLTNAQDSTAIELFRKECDVLSTMVHPNIVEIFDIGEIEDGGGRKPYFVMPLLPGNTLDKLIRDPGQRLTTSRAVDILLQTCRGLQAAHERSIVHRDLKPSNIFILHDYSVKIIDFGIAHLVDARSTIGVKGTLPYMAPEQLRMNKPTPMSDLFSLAVVCYEMLTGRRPFEGKTQDELIHAIQRHIPPAASEFNPSVNLAMAQTVHKAMAKEPLHRFSSVREFGEVLLKASRNEPIEYFDPARVAPRIRRSQEALTSADFDLAAEILTDLESEGYLHPDIPPLRRQIDRAIHDKTVQRLLESARRRFEMREYHLALQKVQEVLNLDASHAEALTLRGNIENECNAERIEEWLRLVSQHLANHSYDRAREALHNVLKLKPKDPRAEQLLAEVVRREQEYLRIRMEKEESYRAVLDAWRDGEISAALTKMQRVLELDRRAPDLTPERGAVYQQTYHQVYSEHNELNRSYAEARKHLADNNLGEALRICQKWLEKYPAHALFQMLKVDVEESQRRELSAFIARIDQEVEATPDLNHRVAILQAALARYPGEAHFERSLQFAGKKREVVDGIVARARGLEERGQFTEAVDQWKTLQSLYPQYPGLEFEIDRLRKRREEQARIETKSYWARQIDQCLNACEYERAAQLCRDALAEFPGDPELSALDVLTRQGLDRVAEARTALDKGQDLIAQGRVQEGLEALTQANDRDSRNIAARKALVTALLKEAESHLATDWRLSEQYAQRAADLDPGNALAKSIRILALDRRQSQFVDDCLARARELQTSGKIGEALAQLDRGLEMYPKDPRLTQLQATLKKALEDMQRSEGRRRDLDELREFGRGSPEVVDASELAPLLERTRRLSQLHAGDSDFQKAATDVEQQLERRRWQLETDASGVPLADVTARFDPERPRHALWLEKMRERAVLAWAAALERMRRVGAGARMLAGRFRGYPIPARAVQIAALAVLVVVGAVMWSRTRNGTQPVAQAALSWPVRVDPPDAVVKIDGQPWNVRSGKARLAPGEHTLWASLDGYQTQEIPFSVFASGTPRAVVMTLRPEPASVRLLVPRGLTAKYDGQAADWTEEGITIADVAAGEHTVELAGPLGAQASFRFRSEPGLPPVLIAPVEAKHLTALVVASFRGKGRFHTNAAPAELRVDGLPAGTVGTDGLETAMLSPGIHHIEMDDGKREVNFDVPVSSAPALAIHVGSDFGGISIETAVRDVKVSVDGTSIHCSQTPSRVLCYNLEPRERVVHLEAPEYKPVDTTIRIAKAQQFTLKPNFQPLPAILLINGAKPGAEVRVDGRVIDRIRPDGGFSHEVDAGEHVVELSLNRHRRRIAPTPRLFRRGQTIELNGADVELIPTFGALKVTAIPPSARVQLFRAKDGVFIRDIRPGFAEDLDEGLYLLEVKGTDEFAGDQRTVEIKGGANVDQVITLARIPRPTQPAVRAMAGDWEDPKGWSQQNGWSLYTAGKRGWHKPLPPQGAEFEFISRGDLTLFFNYKDDDNYISCLLDEGKKANKNLVCSLKEKGGKAKPMASVSGKKFLAIPAGAQYPWKIVIEPGRIVLQSGNEAHVLSGKNLTAGRFGVAGGNPLADLHYAPK